MSIRLLTSTSELKVIEYSLEDLPEVASFFIESIRRGESSVFGFQGDLGAGKTTLIKEIVRQLGVDGLVKSPTYSIQCDYEGVLEEQKLLVSHWDLYRISEAEAIEMYDEYLSEKTNLKRVLFIEWAERLGAYSSIFTHVNILECDGSGHILEEKAVEGLIQKRIIHLKCPEIDK